GWCSILVWNASLTSRLLRLPLLLAICSPESPIARPLLAASLGFSANRRLAESAWSAGPDKSRCAAAGATAGGWDEEGKCGGLTGRSGPASQTSRYSILG